MGHHTKNRNRGNKRQTKRCKRVGGGLKEDARAAFKKADKDNGGDLDQGEYDAARGDIPNMPEFRVVDADKSGSVDEVEFTAAYLFAMADKNGDGDLSQSEYDATFANIPNMPKFGDVDKDTSGSVDFKEFLAAYKTLRGGRRRRKRSTRNKRKSNKKRRTVKRRKSAKRSHRRK
jgi:Ca2+-binding EF-hand superfamily protein